ncbi:MAG: hypothetical protein RQ750_10720 [Roseovarius sp.]|nr:hypothetical protein [Roseovarius sp.]
MAVMRDLFVFQHGQHFGPDQTDNRAKPAGPHADEINEVPDRACLLHLAEKLLEQGYAEAAAYESRSGKKFDRRQLNDRRAKFLMLRVEKNNRAGVDLFRDFKEAIELTDKILRQDDPQHYPFETLAEIARINVVVGHCLDDGHKELISKWLDQLAIYARKRIGMIPSGYQSDKAQIALDKIGSRLS